MNRTKTLHAIFDGKVLKPEKWIDLEVGKRYVLSVESKQEITDIEEDPLFNLSSLAVKMNVPDLATEHDHYLTGYQGEDLMATNRCFVDTVCGIALLNQERELKDVLTSHKHFQQAGFRALLQEDIGSIGGTLELSRGQ